MISLKSIEAGPAGRDGACLIDEVFEGDGNSGECSWIVTTGDFEIDLICSFLSPLVNCRVGV
jgi:hypothetical protein